MTRLGWVDASSGASGDMLLAAALDAGARVEVVQGAIKALGVPVWFATAGTTRAGLRAQLVSVQSTADAQPHRTWRDVRQLLTDAPLDTAVRDRALDVFGRLAAAEAAVHGTTPDRVHFHEVGALDALADVVGGCAALIDLGLDELHAGPVALGAGTARTEHGQLPVPAPAVLQLFAGTAAQVHGGPVDVELCTPTGAAMLTSWVTSWGPLPPIAVTAVGVGAGGRDLEDRPNVLRLVVGDSTTAGGTPAVVLETNVDDLDPRLWPAVLARLLDAGASDAWLTPMLMKKGRPAHQLSVLAPADPALLADLRTLVFTETSAIGLREHAVSKTALDRDTVTVEVDGHPVRVKRAFLDGRVVNAAPEYDDVAAAAGALALPAKAVLAAALAAASARP